jgi:hypothetical protein
MLNIKHNITNNSLLLGNFQTCQIFSNALVFICSLFYLSGYQLTPVLFVTLSNIGLNLYVLKWSVKHKIYDAELFFQTKIKSSIASYLVFAFLFFVKTIFQCIVVFFIFALFIYLTGLTADQYKEHYVLFPFLWILLIIAFTFSLLGAGLHFVRVTSITSKLYPDEKEKLISQFKLNINETNFCTSGSELTGFVSAGFVSTVEGIFYKDLFFTKDNIINYLKIADIPLADFDDNHIKVMTMYNY